MDSPSPADSGGGGGPVLGLLSRGLELWLRQQCEAIETVEIALEGSASQLLRGRLAGVRLRARRVVFQQLAFEQVELYSEAIQVRMGTLLRSRSFELEQAFAVRGVVVFSADGLRRTLGTPQWHDLGDQVAEELLGIAPLGDLRIEDDRLILQAPQCPGDPPLERAVRIAAVDGTVELRSDATEPNCLRLPMDPNVRVERAAVGGGLLELHGDARIQP